MRFSLNRLLSVVVLLNFTYVNNAFAHCQIPCGIYDDHARVKRMLEDTATLRKAVVSIEKFAKKRDVQSKNQWVRWVNNKESHAENIISIVSDYFLTQRVKDTDKDYATRLIHHHGVIVAAMKVKQSVDSKAVDALEAAIMKLAVYYPVHKHP